MDFTSIFNGESLTLEQFVERTKEMKLADLATGDYVAKGKYDSDLKKARDELKTAKDTITTLEANKGDTDVLQAELDKYRQAEEKRQHEAAEAQAMAEIKSRFAAAKGTNEFSSEYAEAGVFEAFRSALDNPANKGKGDNAIFAELTKDKDGVFKPQNSNTNMGGIGNAPTGDKNPPTSTTFFF